MRAGGREQAEVAVGVGDCCSFSRRAAEAMKREVGEAARPDGAASPSEVQKLATKPDATEPSEQRLASATNSNLSASQQAGIHSA